MPELPDVEVFKKEAGKATGARVESVGIADKKFLGDVKKDMEKHLSGKKLTEPFRRGKLLFLNTDDKYAVAMHFGMTGYLRHIRKKDDLPKYVKCFFDLDNDHRLCYFSKRKLGNIEITDNVDEFIHNHDLGPDALEVREQDFIEALKKSKSMIKSFITDQSVIAGIGNVYADEILFQAGIHPKQQADSLDDSRGKDIYDQIGRVLEKAIELQADVSKFPDSFLLTRRKEGEKCPRCGGKVKKLKISGRTGYFCPRCQKEYD